MTASNSNAIITFLKKGHNSISLPLKSQTRAADLNLQTPLRCIKKVLTPHNILFSLSRVKTTIPLLPFSRVLLLLIKIHNQNR